MADPPPFESPIVTTYGVQAAAPLVLIDLSATTKLIVRAAAETRAADALGIGFGSTRRHDDALVCGQRPDEWLVLGRTDAARALVDGLDPTGHVSVIDHTHSRALFRLTGADAARALEKLCGLDWSDDMTPDGAAVSGRVGEVTCDLVRDDEAGSRSYLILCDRSFGQYLFDTIIDAGVEFGLGVGQPR